MFDSRRVLVVDDDREIRDIATMRLEAAGYDVTSAIDGQDGMDMISKQMPDVIVMDLRMPRKDGMGMLTELKARIDTKQIPVVMLSASVIDERRALDAGARFFLSKPYKGADLLSAVRVSLSESVV